MATVASLVVNLTANTSKLDKAFGRTQGMIKNFVRDTKKVTRQLDEVARYGKRAAVGLAAMTAATTGINKLAANHEEAMLRVKAVSRATVAEYHQMSKAAIDLSTVTLHSLSSIEDGMKFLGMAGFNATEIMKLMPIVARTATVGAMEMGDAADLTTTILKGYALGIDDVERATDVLSLTMVSSNNTLKDLGEAFKHAGPVAQSAGLEFETTAAAIALLGDAGIRGSIAGTSLKSAISRLLSPSGSAARILKRLKVETTGATGQLRGLDDIIEDLEKSGASTADIMKIFGMRAGPSMARLVSLGADAFRKYNKELLESQGIAKQIESEQMQSFNAQFKLMLNQLRAFGVELGQDLLPVAKTINHVFVDLVDGFRNMDDETKRNIYRFGLLSAAILGIVTVFGVVAGAISVFIKGFTMLGIVIGFITSPIVLAIAGIALAVGFLKTVWDENWGGIQEKTETVIDAIKGYYQRFLTWWRGTPVESGGFTSGLEYGQRGFKDTLKIFGANVKQAFLDGWDWLVNTTWKEKWEDIKSVLLEVWDIVKNLASVAWDKFSNIAPVKAVIDKLKELYAGLKTWWHGTPVEKEGFTSGFEVDQLGFKHTLQRIGRSVRDAFVDAWGWITETTWKEKWEDIKSVLLEVWDIVKNLASVTWDKFKDTEFYDRLMEIKETITESKAWKFTFDTAIPFALETGEMAIKAVVEFSGDVYKAVKQGFETGEWASFWGIAEDVWSKGALIKIGFDITKAMLNTLRLNISRGLGLSPADAGAVATSGVVLGVITIGIQLAEAMAKDDYDDFMKNIVAASIAGVFGGIVGGPAGAIATFNIALNLKLGERLEVVFAELANVFSYFGYLLENNLSLLDVLTGKAKNLGDEIMSFGEYKHFLETGDGLLESVVSAKSVERYKLIPQEEINALWREFYGDWWKGANLWEKTFGVKPAIDGKEFTEYIQASIPDVIEVKIRPIVVGGKEHSWLDVMVDTGVGNAPQFSSGTPFTGWGALDEPAGIVHKREAVIPWNVLKKGGLAVLDFLGLPGFSSGKRVPITGLGAAKSTIGNMEELFKGLGNMLLVGLTKMFDLIATAIEALAVAFVGEEKLEEIKAVFEKFRSGIQDFFDDMFPEVPGVKEEDQIGEQIASWGKYGKQIRDNFVDAIVSGIPELNVAIATFKQTLAETEDWLAATIDSVSAFIFSSEVFREGLDALSVPVSIVANVFGMVLTPVLKALFPIIKFFGIVLVSVAEIVGKVWNTLLDIVSMVPFVNLKKYKIDVEELSKAKRELIGLTWEDATNFKKLNEQVSEAIRNVPSGLKIVANRMDAAHGVKNVHVQGVSEVRGTSSVGSQSAPIEVHIHGDVYGVDDLDNRIKQGVATAQREMALVTHGV